jgi:hypothetical protein
MALASSPSPCPLGSDFQVESIFKSAWKFRSGPIVSRTCWEAPPRSLSKAFKMNPRPRDGDLNLRDSRFHFTGLEIPRNKRKETETDKKQQNCSLSPIGRTSVQGNTSRYSNNTPQTFLHVLPILRVKRLKIFASRLYLSVLLILRINMDFF